MRPRMRLKSKCNRRRITMIIGAAKIQDGLRPPLFFNPCLIYFL